LSSQIGGFFEALMFKTKICVHASAFTSELEKLLQSILGLELLAVSSKYAKDLVAGKAVANTKGLNYIIPNVELTKFNIDDWIQIGDQHGGQPFLTVDMATVAPFTVTLSSPYLGKSSPSASIYQHGFPLTQKGCQYIVLFDTVLGDLPKLGINCLCLVTGILTRV
jgi:hypothetical protein